MSGSELQHCRDRIAEEERLAREAPSWEAGLIHEQLAMLYRAQLAALSRKSQARNEDMELPRTAKPIRGMPGRQQN